MAEYDAWAENLFDAYVKSIEVQADYGAMNWGDWFGERRVNWGNHEYDTANQILIQYARTADPRYFYVADATARHKSLYSRHHKSRYFCATCHDVSNAALANLNKAIQDEVERLTLANFKATAFQRSFSTRSELFSCRRDR